MQWSEGEAVGRCIRDGRQDRNLTTARHDALSRSETLPRSINGKLSLTSELVSLAPETKSYLHHVS